MSSEDINEMQEQGDERLKKLSTGHVNMTVVKSAFPPAGYL
jgi:hypothetical protein